MITILEKFLTELEMVGGGVGVKAITRTATAVKNSDNQSRCVVLLQSQFAVSCLKSLCEVHAKVHKSVLVFYFTSF